MYRSCVTASIEYVYSPWLRMSQAQLAADDMLHIRAGEFVQQTVRPLITLDAWETLFVLVSGTPTPTCLQYKDVAVQTNHVLSPYHACFSKVSLGRPITNSTHFGTFLSPVSIIRTPDHIIAIYKLGHQPTYLCSTKCEV